ncbi:MAG: tetratricopeptide repeat protein [Flavobacteriales bacterium]|nr:tetratricopeptide repeat protein [Flavobacteriales bacterium]
MNIIGQDLAHAGGADRSVDELFAKGEEAYRAAEHAQAIGFYDQVLELDPEHMNAYLQRGFCNSLVKRYDAAVKDFSAVIARKPDHVWAFISRGSAYNKLEQYDKAMLDFDMALSLDPENQEAYNNRGWSKKALGDPKGACKDWKTSQRNGNSEARIILSNNRCK